jgi:Protein of unknown function (DUF5818)
MIKTLLLALSLFATVAWLQAQNQYPQTGSSQTTAAGETSVKGCLQGSDGNYTLTTKTGTVYQLQGDSSKLSEHIGHEVQITGSTTMASNAPNSTPGTPAGGTPQQTTLTVQSVKHISKTCTSAAAK